MPGSRLPHTGTYPRFPRGRRRAAATRLAGYDAGAGAGLHIVGGTRHVALGASGTALLHTVAVLLGERFFGE